MPDNSGFETDEESDAASLLEWLEGKGRWNENTGSWGDGPARAIVTLTKFAAAIEHFGPELAKAMRRLAAHIESRPVPERSRRR